MALDLQQTDTAMDCAVAAFCSGLTANGASGAKQASQGGTAGTVENTVKIDNLASNERAFYTECIIPAGATWAAGTWTVRFNCTTAVSGVTIASIYICRVNSSCVSQATIGSATGLSIDLGTTGVKSQAVTGAAQTPGAGDKVVIVFGISNTNEHGNQTVGRTHNQLINTPFSVASTYNEASTFSCAAAVAETNVMSMGVARTLSATAALGEAGNLSMLPALSLTATAAVSQTGGLAFDKSLSLAATAAIVEDASTGYGVSLSLPATAVIGQSALMDAVAAGGLLG